MIVCDSELLHLIYEDARNKYPRECCGILLGEREGNGTRRVRQIYKVNNGAEENIQQQHFMIPANDILYAERIAQINQYEIVGCYHSHINCEAVASEEDSRFAIPGISYLIVSVRNGQIGELSSWEKTGLKENESLVEEMMKIKS